MRSRGFSQKYSCQFCIRKYTLLKLKFFFHGRFLFLVVRLRRPFEVYRVLDEQLIGNGSLKLQCLMIWVEVFLNQNTERKYSTSITYANRNDECWLCATSTSDHYMRDLLIAFGKYGVAQNNISIGFSKPWSYWSYISQSHFSLRKPIFTPHID